MAKKRLNKKVAIIGTIILGIFIVGAIYVVLRLTQGPEKFIKDGDVAYAAGKYEAASKAYGRGLARAKKPELRKAVLFKLVEVFKKQNDWQRILACWNQVITVDTKDIPSRTGLLDFYYDMADSGQGGAWKHVLTTVDELINIDPKSRYYLLKGRALYELAERGDIADREKAIADSTTALLKAKTLNPKDPSPYLYMAQAALLKGELLAARGLASEKEHGISQAASLLTQAVTAAPKDPNTHVNLLNLKIRAAREKDKSIQPYEAEFVGLTKKFPSSAVVFSSLAGFYSMDANSMDKAVSASQKAYQLDKYNITNAVNTAQLYYSKGAFTNDPKYKQTAIDIAKYSLTLPNAQATQGPREWINKMNSLTLNTFLANAYIWQVMDLPADAPKDKRDAILAQARQAAHEIRQIWGSGDNPYVLEVEGMIEYASGERVESVKKMYTAYDQLKQTDTTPPYKNVQLGELSYMLAQAVKDSPEIGASNEFLYNAVVRGKYRTKPEALLEYAQTLLALRAGDKAIDPIQAYEHLVKPNMQSAIIKVRANLAAGQIDEAQTILDKMKSEDPNVLAIKFSLLQSRIDHASASLVENNGKENQEVIKADINKYTDAQAALAIRIIGASPTYAQLTKVVIDRYVAQERLPQAKAFLEKVKAKHPDDTTVKFCSLYLAEPNVAKITQERRIELTEKLLTEIKDPFERAVNLADQYRTKEQFDKAIAEYKKALQIKPTDKTVINALFESALQSKDYALADQMVGVARRENLDFCQGNVFAARIHLAKKEYNEAVDKLDQAIKIRPISSMAYLLRSTANGALDKPDLAIADARKAAGFNPLDGMTAKQLANLLYHRNVKLGSNLTAEQRNEAKNAIKNAYSLNQQEWQLLSFYAEYISDTSPAEALSIRQRLQAVVPTVGNATLLGNIATRMAAETRDMQMKKGYLELAQNAYEQGYKIDPQNPELLFNYARFFRLNDQPEKAAKLLGGANDKNLMWQYYITTNQMDQAARILADLYKADPKNIKVLKGLLVVAQNTGDGENAAKYSQELLSFENTPQNQLAQIQAYLDTGLINQAQKQLAAYREKYPADNTAMLLQAYLHTRKGEYKESMDLLNKELTTNSGDAGAWRLRGLVNMAMGNYEDAIRDLDKSKSINNNLQIRTDLARAYLRAHRNDDAINELTVALSENQNSNDVRQMLESVYLQLNKKDALKKFYTDTIKVDPDVPYWYNRAGSYALSQSEYTSSESYFKAALAVVQKINNPAMLPQGRASLDGYLLSLIQAKKYDELLAQAAKYIDSVYAPIAYSRIGEAKSKVGDKAASIEAYHKALVKAQADDSLVFEILGRMGTVVGFDETSAWCIEQLKAAPESFMLNLAMANIAKTKSDFNKALDYTEKCIKIAGPKGAQYRSLIDMKQGLLVAAYRKTSEKHYFDDAIKLYEDALEDVAMEGKPLIYNNLAYLICDNAHTDADVDKALGYARKAYESLPNNPNILDTYCIVLYRKGDYAKAAENVALAKQMFERAAVTAPAEVYLHSGMINEKLSRKAQALADYKQALEAGDQSLSDKEKESAKQAIQRLK